MKLLANAQFGKNLRSLREMRNLTQEEIVKRMQLLGSPLSRSTYSLIEMGRGNIFVTDLVAIKEILCVDFSQFFQDVGTARE